MRTVLVAALLLASLAASPAAALSTSAGKTTRNFVSEKRAAAEAYAAEHPPVGPEYNTTFHWGINMTMADGVVLHSDATVPKPLSPGEKFPLIIFPNSWSLPEIEYITRCHSFAKKGYVAVEYETRGWYNCGGLIDVAGPLDRSDGTTVIDYILDTYGDAWSINASAIAFAGISYGAGISLMMAGHDPRVRTAVSLSGWANLTTAMYHHNSPNYQSIQQLISLGEAVGRVMPEMKSFANDFKEHKNISSLECFCDIRSPSMYIDAINLGNKPIFMSNNIFDRFFNPQDNVNLMWSQVQTPKYLILNHGPHAIAGILGLLFSHNFIWGKAELWLDHYLRGVENGITKEPRVRMQLGTSIFSMDYIGFKDWPARRVAMTPLALTPRGSNSFGALVGNIPTAPEGIALNSYVSHEVIAESVRLDAAATAADMTARVPAPFRGSPFLKKAIAEAAQESAHAARRDATAPFGGDAAVTGTNDMIAYTTTPGCNEASGDFKRALGIPSLTNLSLAKGNNSIVYVSRPLTRTISVCGFPTISGLTFHPVVPAQTWQIYSFFYMVDSKGDGAFISDGEYTHYPEDGHVGASVTLPKWEMRTVCQKFPAGYSIGLGFALYNKFLLAANTDLAIIFDYETTKPVIQIPIVKKL